MPPYTPQELNLYQGTDTWSVKQNSSDGAAGGKWTFSASGDSGAESMVFAGDLMVQSAQGSDYVVVFSDIRANEAAISAASVAFRAGDADLSDQIAALSSSAEASVAAVAQNLASETARATAADVAGDHGHLPVQGAHHGELALGLDLVGEQHRLPGDKG